MPFNAKTFLSNHGIPWTDKGKHSRQEWVQIKCPMCSGNPGWHGGLNLNQAYYHCWRCGSHYLPKIISLLLKTSIPKAKQLIKPYLTGEQIREFKVRQYVDKIEYPNGTGPLIKKHQKYLESRNFDPEKLSWDWGLLSTGKWDKYADRILAPITLDGRIISYQCRAPNDETNPKYMACEEKNEVYHLKFTFYGIDHCHNDTAVIVEGITDVWRLGFGAVGTFGIDYLLPQVTMIAKRFKRYFIFFDDDPQAQEKADQLAFDLGRFNMEGEILECVGDPGSLSNEDAKKLMEELL